jgi:hypothetical protein
MPPEVRQTIRYISLHWLTEKERVATAPIIAGHCQHLSRSADIVRPVRVGMLLRVNLDDYGWKAETWDKLQDPYYVEVQKVDYIEKEVEVVTYEDVKPGVKASDGKLYPGVGRIKWTEKKTVRVPVEPVKVAALAPWLVETEADKARIAEVLEWTGSRVPVTRADWWFNQTAIQADREAGYYDWLGVKDEKDFQKLIGFDRKLFEGFRIELREAVALSGVTLQPRAITRHDSAGGGYFRSLDFKVAKGKQNPLDVLGKDLEEAYDASEQYGVLPNKFWTTGLFDRAGKRQDFAPPEIASDGASRSHDKRVHVNVSCTRCHTNGGIQDIDGWIRNLLNPPLELRTADYKKQRELRQQYLRRLEPFLNRDRMQFEDAVKEATGLDSKKYAAAYGAFWESYEDRQVTADIAARDIGITAVELRKKLLAWIKAGYELSPTASVFVHEGKHARAVGIRQYEQVHAELQRIVRSVK